MDADFDCRCFPVTWPRRTDFDSGLFRLTGLDTLILTSDFYVRYGAQGGWTGRQGMLTPPWHLIPPLIYSEVRVRHSPICISNGTHEIDYCSLFFVISLPIDFCVWNGAGVTGQVGILTPPCILIPLLVYPEVCLCPIIWLYFYRTYETDDCS
jgi:hypothetical protein